MSKTPHTSNQQDNTLPVHSKGIQLREPQAKDPIGLINTGNSCFLNAIIQLLYGIKGLTTLLIESSKTRSDKKLSITLGLILQLLENKAYDYQKQIKLLQRLAHSLFMQEIRSKRYSQQDAINIFLNILSLLEEEHKRQIQKFDIQYKAKCNCNYSFNTMERIVSYRYIKCSECNRQIKRTLTTIPKYIFYRKQSYQPFERKREEMSQNGYRQYAYKAQIIYHDFGGRMYGHYVARRIEQDKQYQFDDSRVRLVQQIQHRQVSYQNTGMLMLYQLIEPKQTLKKSPSHFAIQQKGQTVSSHSTNKDLKRQQTKNGDQDKGPNPRQKKPVDQPIISPAKIPTKQTKQTTKILPTIQHQPPPTGQSQQETSSKIASSSKKNNGKN